MKLTLWDSVSGNSLSVGNVCHVRQPKLSDIRSLGYDKFFSYVSVILFDPSEIDGEVPMLIPDLETFYILITYPMLRETFFEALSFFVEEDISFDGNNLCLKVYKDNQVVGEINNGNFNDIQGLVAQIIGTEKEYESDIKFSNKKAKAIYEKCKARKREFDKAKKKEDLAASNDFTLPNIISAVCAKHPSLNLLNIWDLTILQLYDQFRRLNVITYESVEGLRWAAWGKDSIELSAWFKDLTNK